MKNRILLCVVFIVSLVSVAKSQCTPPAAPGVTSPVTYCQNAVAVPLTASGTNLMWGNLTPGTAGGTNNLSTTTYIDNNYNNRKLNFTTTRPNVTITSIDFYIPPYQTVIGLKLSLYNSAGTVIATSPTSTTTSAGATALKITNTFNYPIVAAGNYSVGVSAGVGNIGADNPSYPITEPTGTINITGGASSGIRCFNNIKFPADASSTAPTPSTATAGTFNYTVTQTVGGCTSAPATISVIVTAMPAATISYAGNPFCNSQAGNVTVTQTGTTGGTYSSTAGLSLNAGTGAITPSLSSPGTYTVTYTMAGSGGCANQVATTSVVIKAAPEVTINKTETCLGANTGTITATAAGNIGPYTYSLNGAAYQASGNFTGLAAGNYTLNVMGNTGCITSNVVTITQPANSTDDQNIAGSDTWVGHMYDGINFNNYVGQFAEQETFSETFGASASTCFDVQSAGNARSVYTETFSVKFKMNSTKRGLYVANLGSDDGARLTVDGSMIFNNWTDHSFNVNSSVLMNLGGSSNLLYEYYENAASNQVIFQNFTRLIGNTLTGNITQSVCIGNSAAAISGDVFASLPAGISLSGTGYQWTYSTSPGGTRVNIAGATGASFTPSTAVAPFNTAGTYYVYRSARLSSNNNIAYSPYVAANESNAAVIIVSGGGQWTGSVSTDWAVGANWCTGVVPTAATDVIIKSTAVRMPEVITTGTCRNLTIESGATVSTLLAGTLNIAGTLANAGTMTNNGTTNFNGAALQTFSGVTIFNNLTVNNPAGLVLPATITVNGNVLIAAGVLDANNYSMGVKGNWTNNASLNAFNSGTGTILFNGTTSQVISGTFATRFNNITISNTNSTVSLNVNAQVKGNLSVSIGTFDLGAFTANRETAGGTLTVANNAVLKIGGTNTFPANFSTNSLIVASTVEYNGTNQTVANVTYGNLLVSSAAGSVVKTFPGTALTVVGNLTSVKGAGTAVNFVAGAAIAVNGNVLIDAGTSFDAASFTHTMGANWVNNGTFNGNTGTIIFTATGASISGSGAQNFNNLTLAASQITFSNNSVTLTGNLATTGSGSFSLPAGGTLTMTGAGKTISGFGISVDNLVISGTVSTSSSLGITGNLTVSGGFTASNGVITMSGTAKTISGAGAKSFAAVYITGSVTTTVDFQISTALTVGGTLSASAGTVTFIGNSTLSGRADLFNTRINGTSLRLSSGSVLGVAGSMTISAGILDVTSSTPNTVDFNGASAQNINAITYNNLVLSNGNIKTAIAGLTVNNNISIAASTSFSPGNFTHSIYGNWYNNGTFSAGTSTIQFLGSQNSDIFGATTFNILTVNASNASTAIILHSNVGASVVNMVNGNMLTGTNTLTITNTRTGNGIILGHITRTHAFTTGVAYAFEGPNNSIRFTSIVTPINSVSVYVYQGSITDFPYNAAISRTYDISIPVTDYTADLRLHYEDAELNGNNESSLVLWNYSGVYWLPFGKSANSTSDNYVEQTGLVNLNNRWTCGYTANVAEWNGSLSSDWSVPNNWTVLQGSPSRPPSVNDVAVIGYSTFNNQPTISTAVNVKNIVLGSAKAVALSLAPGGSLATGDIVGIWNAGNATHTINVNDQTVNIAGNLALSDGTANHLTNLTIGNGSLNIAGSLWQFGGAGVSFTGSGILSIRDNYQYTNGNFIRGTGTVIYNGSVNQTVAAVNYHHLTINKTTSTAFISDSTNISGNLTLSSGELETTASTVVTGDVNILPGALFENESRIRVGGNWNNTGTYSSIAAGTRVIFNGTGSQNISATTFHDLEINKPVGSVATLTGDVVLKGDLIGTSGTLDIKSFFFNRDNVGGSARIFDNGTLIIAANNAPNKFSNYTLGAASTVIFNGTGTQHLLLPGMVYGNLIFRNSGTKILYTPIGVNGDLTIENTAIFDGGSNTITLNGNWINNGTYVPSTSTVLCAGNLKNISGNNIFNRLTVSGSYTMLNNNTINELLRITSTGNINGGAGIVTTMNGDLINNGILYTLGTTTFTGNILQTLSLINAVQTVAITVNFNGSVSPVLNSTTAPQYGFLNINNTGGVNASVGYNILYGLSVGAGASFNAGASTHNLYGYLNNNGTITSSGTFNILPAAATSINLGTNFSSTGRVVFGGAGAISMSGAPLSFRNITISNTNAAGVSPSSDWLLTNTLTINSGSAFNAGNHIYTLGGNIDNHGVINCGTSQFKMKGTIPQSIFSASPLYNLWIENNAAPVTLLSDLAVNQVLDFISGKIATGSFKLYQPASGSIVHASQTTGWVNGNLQKEITGAVAQRSFETGDDNFYAPLSLSFQNVATAGRVTVTTIGSDHPYLNLSRINNSKSVNRYWKLINTGIGFNTYNAIAKYPASNIDAGTQAAALGSSVYDGTNWTVVETNAASDTSTTVTGSTIIGDLAIGEVCNKNTGIAYSAAHYCTTSGTVSPVLTGNAGGVYSSSAGLTINAATGAITPATSAAGEYKIYYTVAATSECAQYVTSATVFIDEAPAASIAYGNGPFCTGGGIIVPAFSGTTGGIFSATSGLYIDPSNGAINLAANTAGSYVATYSIAAYGGCAAISYNSPVVIQKPGLWTGGRNSRWNDPSNWLCGIIPANGADIKIDSAVSYYPVIDSGIVVALNNLTISSGASVKVKQATLKLSGVLENFGSVDAAAGTLQFSGSVPQTIKANTFLNNAVAHLVIDNSSDSGVVLAGPVDVFETLTYAGTGKHFTTNDFLTLKSTNSGTARVGNMTSHSIVGNVSVERYLPARKAWQFLAVPTNTSQNINQSWQEGATSTTQNPTPGYGTQISSNRSTWLADGFDFNSPGIGVKKYDPLSDQWVGVTNTNQSSIRSQEGYMIYVRGDRTILGSSPGSMVAPTVLRTKGLLYTGSLPALTVLPGKYLSVANPYASPIDLRKITKTGIKDFYYAWDPALNGLYGAGGYQTFSPDGNGNYTITPGGGSYGVGGSINNFLASGQAFFVQASPAGGTIQFTENAKYDPLDTSNSGILHKQLRVNLLTVNADSSTFVSDGLLVNFSENNNNGLDDQDAIKFANAGENLASVAQNKSLIVEGHVTPVNKDTIYMKVSNLKIQRYQFNINTSLLDGNGRTAFLVDRYKQTSTPLQLNGNTAINFTVENVAASYANNRFMIVFDRYSVLPVSFTSVTARAVANTVDVDWKTGGEINIDHYDVERSHDGTQFVKISSKNALGAASGSYSINDAQPFADINYYRIKAIENSGASFYSDIVKVTMEQVRPGINVYPNPVTDGKTMLQLNSLAKGKATLTLFNNAGQLVYSSSVNNTGRSSGYPLELGKTVSVGIYQLIVADADGSRYATEIIVQ